jgi:hypothetical protein
MRDYSKVSGNFWTGKTGRLLRGDTETQVAAMYLMTSNHGNMIGVFHLPILYLSHETGISIEGASKALARLSEEGFCTYDDASEVVWVHEAARFQIGASLMPNDKQVKGVQKQYDALPEGMIKTGFFERYADAFHLRRNTTKAIEITSPLKAPPKPVAVAVAVAVPSAHDGIVFDGNGFQNLNGYLSSWESAYPAVNVKSEIAKAAAWLISNPKNKKSNYARFLNNWLSSAQDKAPKAGGTPSFQLDPFRGAI